MRVLLLNNRMMYKFSKDNEESSKKVKEEAEKAEEAKTSEDDETQDREEKIVVKNYGKALKSYTASENASAANKAKS